MSTRAPEEQAAFATAEVLPFPLLSDTQLQLTAHLRLPAFRAGQRLRIERPILVIGPERTVWHTLFPSPAVPGHRHPGGRGAGVRTRRRPPARVSVAPRAEEEASGSPLSS
ncbi:hypothetical protein [Streptomyces sp. NPDC046759]|uniref:hypothetical protein n=1 Tax=Streptomyces sp. NPDC046759 TaxID=3155019 RepID=UPI0033EC703F